MLRRGDQSHRAHEREDSQEPVLQQRDDVDEAVAQRPVTVNSAPLFEERPRCEGADQGLVAQLVLALEDPEDGSLGDAGTGGDLLGGDSSAVLGEQWDDRVDDRAPALVRRKWGCPPGPALMTRHGAILSE